MCAQFQRSRVVGHYEHLVIYAPVFKFLPDVAHNLFVYQLYRFHFVLNLMSVSAFVRRLHVYIHIVAAIRKRLYSGACLAVKIRMHITGRALNIYRVHSGAYCNALYKVNRRYDTALYAEFFFKALKLRLSAFSPYPYGICLVESPLCPVEVYRVIVENVIAAFHHVIQILRTLTLGHIVADALFEYIVRRSERKAHRALVPHERMAVADTGIEFEHVVAKVLLYRLYKHLCLVRGYLVRAVVGDYLVIVVLLILCHGDKVAAEHHIGVLHVNTYTDRLKRTSAGIEFLRIVTHCGKIRHITAGCQVFGHIAHKSHGSVSAHIVYVGFVCGFERSFAAQLVHRIICHAVSKNNYVLHNISPLVYIFCARHVHISKAAHNCSRHFGI